MLVVALTTLVPKTLSLVSSRDYESTVINRSSRDGEVAMEIQTAWRPRDTTDPTRGSSNLLAAAAAV